ncbi:DUF4136 domain-containing protein [Mucilaginibacter gynuensis]
MKRSIYLGLLILCISVLSACSNYRYYTAAKNKTNFGSYRTFGWVRMKQPDNNPQKIYSNDIAFENIKDAANDALKAKGLTLQDDQPDLYVNYTAMTGRGYKTQYYSPYYGGFYGGGWGWGGWGGWGYRPFYGGGWGWGGYGGGYADRVPFREGTIIIDLIDRKTGKMVWRGYGVGELRNPQKAINDLPKVVSGIIAQLKLSADNKS